MLPWLGRLVKFHGIRTGRDKRYERLNKEELLALAERAFNAIQNDDLNNFRKTLQSDKVLLKVPQTREDLGQIRFRDLVQWIRSQGVAVEGRNTKKDKALALAQNDMGCGGKRYYRQNEEEQAIVCQNSSGLGRHSASDQKGLSTMD